jgi:crotonobetainyl-CoA:carnitine CoA-transferase CaiB-like acyl-CoA transferase
VISLGGDIEKFAGAIGREDLILLADDRMANRDAFTKILGEELASWTYERLDKALAPHALWYERVHDYDAIRNDPQVLHNGCLQEFTVKDEKATVLAHPVRYDGKVPAFRRMPVTLGGDTRDILAEAGWSSADIDDMARTNAVNLGQTD